MVDACWDALTGLRTWSFTVGRFPLSLTGSLRTHSAGVVRTARGLQDGLLTARELLTARHLLLTLSGDKQSHGSKMYCGAGARAAEATYLVALSRGPPHPPRSRHVLNSSLAGHQRPAEP